MGAFVWRPFNKLLLWSESAVELPVKMSQPRAANGQFTTWRRDLPIYGSPDATAIAHTAGPPFVRCSTTAPTLVCKCSSSSDDVLLLLARLP